MVNVFICVFINDDFNTVSYSLYMNDIVQCEISFISVYNIMYVLMYNDETIVKKE